MILDYHRPENLDEALGLLSRKSPITFPLSGGTMLNQIKNADFEVVDLQSLEIDQLKKESKVWRLGAMLTLQTLCTTNGIHKALAHAIQHQATYNVRQIASVAGALVAADGRSAFATAMLALDTKLKISKLHQDIKKIGLGDFLPLRSDHLQGSLITEVIIPVNLKLEYQYVARTPADLPIVCVAVAKWPSGRTRVVLGGFGNSPQLALDGISDDAAAAAARESYREAGDSWASAVYRSEMAAILTARCLRKL